MGCCSGSDNTSKGGEQDSKHIKPRINLENYTYFPGAIKQTDYTKSQNRTGWASELERKRHISATEYYRPTYSVLASHGNRESALRSNSGMFSSSFVNYTNKKKEKNNSSTNAEKHGANNNDFEHPRPTNKKNYFGKH